MKHLKITTSELSKICGVSQGTVDRALNNRSDISAETKRMIINVAKQYGYREYVDSNSDNKIIGQVGIIVFNLNNEKEFYKAIIYFISGMTDNFAIEIYNEIIGF